MKVACGVYRREGLVRFLVSFGAGTLQEAKALGYARRDAVLERCAHGSAMFAIPWSACQIGGSLLLDGALQHGHHAMRERGIIFGAEENEVGVASISFAVEELG